MQTARQFPLIDPAEALALADRYVASRPQRFNIEETFVARLVSGGLFLEGMRCRVVLYADGRRRVYADHSGELLAESRPGSPLTVARSFKTAEPRA